MYLPAKSLSLTKQCYSIELWKKYLLVKLDPKVSTFGNYMTTIGSTKGSILKPSSMRQEMMSFVLYVDFVYKDIFGMEFQQSRPRALNTEVLWSKTSLFGPFYLSI